MIERCLLITALGVCFLPAAASAQDVVSIDGAPTCPSCFIEMQEILVVTSPERVGLTPVDKLALAPDQAAWLSPFALPHALIRFTRSATPDVWIEEEGQGPREFQRIRRMAFAPDGTLYVFGDAKYNRYTPAGDYIDTHRPTAAVIRQVLDVVILPDGSIVLNGAAPSPEPDREIFHLIDPDGELVRSFGPMTRGFEFDPEETRHRLTPSDATAFWAAASNRYEIDLWHVLGTHRKRIARRVDWFQPWSGRFEPPVEQPPKPRIRDIDEDSAGNLWVLLHLPAEDFAPLPPVSDSAITAAVDAESTAFDSLIEILDPATGQVIASRRFSNMLLSGFLDNHHTLLLGVDANGEQTFHVNRLALSR